ncbi:MAG: hypothetical protein IJY31_00190 [Muribaculaceae bacterium]|nr:hypothetical protein [Muribaculaceae bacterium]
MSKDTLIPGNAAISGNVSIGGRIISQGNGHIKGNLKVEGWLDAPNIKSPCKGLFTSLDKLQSLYPSPSSGWWALVGTTLPADIYAACGGEWTATGGQGGSGAIDLPAYDDMLSDMTASINEISGNADNNSEKIAALEILLISIKTTADNSLVKAEVVQQLYNELKVLVDENGKAIAGKQDALTPGRGVAITGNTISCTLDNQIFAVVDALPTENINANKIYLVRSDVNGEENVFTEYSYINGNWEVIGTYTAEVNLTPYLTKTEAAEKYVDLTAYNAHKLAFQVVSNKVSDIENDVSEMESGQAVVNFNRLADTSDTLTISTVAYVLNTTRNDAITQRYLKKGTIFIFWGESGHEAWLLVDPDNVTDTANAWQRMMWSASDVPDTVVTKTGFTTTLGVVAGGKVDYGSAFGYATDFEGNRAYMVKTGSVQDAVAQLLDDSRRLEQEKASKDYVDNGLTKAADNVTTTLGVAAGTLIERPGVTHGEGMYGGKVSVSDAFRGVYDDLVAMDAGLVAVENAVAGCASADELARVNADYDSRCELLKEEKLDLACLKTVNGVSLWGGNGGNITDLEVSKIHMPFENWQNDVNGVTWYDYDFDDSWGVIPTELPAAIEKGKAIVIHHRDGSKHNSSTVICATCSHNDDGKVSEINLLFYASDMILYNMQMLITYPTGMDGVTFQCDFYITKKS